MKPIGKAVAIAAGVPVLLMVIIAISSYHSTALFIQTSSQVAHGQRAIEQLKDLLSEMQDVETGYRGYVITGSDSYLDPYRQAVGGLDQQIADLRALLAADPSQMERLRALESLGSEKLRLASQVIDVRQSRGLDAATAVIQNGRGKQIMDGIRAEVAAMEGAERDRVGELSLLANARGRRTIAVVAIGGIAGFIFVTVAGIIIGRELARRRRAEQQQEQFFTLSLDMLCIASGDGRFQRLNPAWRILGFTNEELCAAPNIDFVHPEDRAATEAMGRRLAAGETAVGFENRYRCKDGSYRVLMWKAAASPDRSSIFAAARDITDWKAADAAIKAAEERLRLLLESVRDYAIIMLSPTGAVTTWNPGAERIKGYAAGEIVGHHFSRFYPPEEIEGGKPERELAIASERGRYEEEGWRVRKDGSKFWANTVLTAVRDEAGTLRGFAKVTRDITDRKRAEDEIRSLNDALQRHTAQLESANKELEAFCYSVSHDLRAPLRGIDGFSQALLEDYGSKLDEEGRDSLHRVRNGTQRMGQLIDDLLNLSRVTRAEIRREPVDLSAIARGVAEELKAADPRRQVTFDIAEGITAVADPNLLRVVLTNLIGNAWKFTGQQAEARVEFGCSGSNGDRVYFVRDNGVGFDMAYANKLFGAFQRLHAQGDFPGTGVGLATVQRIIHRHGGQVRATAELGLGAAFSFTL